MSHSPLYVGNLLPLMTVPITKDDGSPFSLVGRVSGDFRLVMVNRSTTQETTGAGTFTVTDASGGICVYTWATADTDTAADFNLYVIITISGKEEEFGPIFLRVQEHAEDI